MRRWIDALNTLLATAVVAHAAWAWPQLPSEIPAHFGLDGQPDRWTTTTASSWFWMPSVAIALAVLLWVLREWAVRRPGSLNLPGGKKLEDYDAPTRSGIVEHIKLMLAIVSTELLVIFGLIQFGSFRTAMGGRGENSILAVLAIAMLSSPVLLIVFFLGFQRATRVAPK
jgi:uncharacterized membrane protein